MNTLFLGRPGRTAFQRHMQYAYPGTGVDVAEIDRAVTNANWLATGLPKDSPIKTHWGDARQFVELHENSKQYDLVFGDAFNDFSVPWHLTTREFNEKIKKMLSPNGVYMINIIDVYESDEHAQESAQKKIDDQKITDPCEAGQDPRRSPGATAHRYGGFVGSLDQDRQTHVGQRLYLRHRQYPRWGLARNVCGCRVHETARPRRPGPPAT